MPSNRSFWPGLALLAPAIVGTDIAAILALSFGSPRKSVLIWMTASLAIWTMLLAYGTVYGLSFVEYFRREENESLRN
nr:hypothetical protein [Aneurinibacillus sp. XH2]